MAETVAQTDSAFWAERLYALARVASADGMAVVLPLPGGKYVPYAQLNLGPNEEWLSGTPQYLIWYAMQQREAQRRTGAQVRLADGRTADALLAAPLVRASKVVGALVTAREDDAFDEADVAVATELANLVALELAVSNVLRRPAASGTDVRLPRIEEDRKHAIVLYELERIVARSPDPATLVRRAVRLFANALDCDQVVVWRHEPDGWLQLAQSRGFDAQLKPLRVDIDITLARVVRDGATQVVVRRKDGAGAVWMGSAKEALITGIAAEGRVKGALLLGRQSRSFTPAEMALAPVLGGALAADLGDTVMLGDVGREAEPMEVAAAEPPAIDATTVAPATPVATRAGGVIAAPSQEATVVSGTAPETLPARRRAGQFWATLLIVTAVIVGGAALATGEPLIYALAGLLLLAALVAFLL